MSDSSSILSTILNSELVRWLAMQAVEFWREQRFNGLYKVGEHVSTLKLCDPHGYIATYSKRQDITYTQDGVFAIQDQAWGDGDIFADYVCSPGFAADRYEEGHRWKILISLQATKNRGQHEQIFIQRTIRDGFATPVNNFSVNVDHPTKRLVLSIILPRKRPPTAILLLEQNARRSISLDEQHTSLTPDGDIVVSYSIEKPRLFEEYSLRWEW